MTRATQNAKALNAFIARKVEIDAMLARLTALSDEHFDVHPDEVHFRAAKLPVAKVASCQNCAVGNFSPGEIMGSRRSRQGGSRGEPWRSRPSG